MKKIGELRAAFLKKDGTWEYYPITLGDNHHVIIENFCQKNGIHYPSIENVIKEGHIIFYNASKGIILNFLPKEISESQYYQLDLFSLFMDDITYMEVRKEGQKNDFILKDNIGERYGKEVIQSYFEEKNTITL